MVRPTRYFCNIVAWVKVPELCSGGPILLDGDVANTKLAVLSLTASKHVSISRQKARVLQATVDLNDLILSVEVQAQWQRIGLVFGRSHPEADGTII